ncbi:MAG: hypothetical protein IPL55_11300 [Saprospiraceae bacterium]|jgi:predicted nucleic-acid-binding Zn-ribbon protein|nr:hypothetical protein [Saprospiraceae bacterium]MBL0024545.1 hypothetical protein [Saprospiraceae bacterium]
MKYNKCCPKCQSTEIAIIEGGTFKGNVYNTISTGLNTIFLTRYLCTQCGFTENYLDDVNDLKKLKDKFVRPSDSTDFV